MADAVRLFSARAMSLNGKRKVMPKRTDRNQVEIVTALRKIGCTVLHLHTIGKGAPDILVGYRQKNWLMEIKDGAKRPSERKLTDDEIIFHANWRGQICVVESIDDAIKYVTE